MKEQYKIVFCDKVLKYDHKYWLCDKCNTTRVLMLGKNSSRKFKKYLKIL